MSHPQSSRTYRHQHPQALPSRPHSPVRSRCQVPFSCSPQAPLPYKHLPPGSSPLPRSPLQVLSPLRTTLGEHRSPMALMPTGTGPPRCQHVPQVPCFTALFPPDTSPLRCRLLQAPLLHGLLPHSAAGWVARPKILVLYAATPVLSTSSRPSAAGMCPLHHPSPRCTLLRAFLLHCWQQEMLNSPSPARPLTCCELSLVHRSSGALPQCPFPFRELLGGGSCAAGGCGALRCFAEP